MPCLAFLFLRISKSSLAYGLLLLLFVRCSGMTNNPPSASGSTLTGTTLSADGISTAVVSPGQTQVTVTPSSGTSFTQVILDLGSDFLATNICNNKSIFGRVGTALCDLVFADLAMSHIPRTRGTSQASFSSEANSGSCSTVSLTTRASCEAVSATWTPTHLTTGFHAIPNIITDNVLQSNTTPSSTATLTFDFSAINSACGTSGSIADRISNCQTAFGSAASFNGETQSTMGYGNWSLVTRTAGGRFVFRDERTQLLWSDISSQSVNWCQASGNADAADPDNFCNNPANQDQTIPYSGCFEGTDTDGLTRQAISGSGEDYSAGSYSERKGSMGLQSSTKVAWRLPTLTDFFQALANGYLSVRTGNSAWTSSSAGLAGSNTGSAYILQMYTGPDTIGLFSIDRSTTTSYVCVGH